MEVKKGIVTFPSNTVINITGGVEVPVLISEGTMYVPAMILPEILEESPNKSKGIVTKPETKISESPDDADLSPTPSSKSVAGPLTEADLMSVAREEIERMLIEDYQVNPQRLPRSK